ncbi:DUF6476 family protein [Mesobacterium pallidum]|uniref:DUF6476 family protein n=1 Tax=Mesobacterium pallidum TaxID=2872037 RepID=UPI001EE32D58|nr:DUF6476 family protein [Mesobacterium pallidum]
MGDTPEDTAFEEPGSLRFLRRLVTALTLVMIVGLVTVITLLVTRLTSEPDPMVLPASIALPEGATAAAFTRGPDWLAVVTGDGRILIYGLDGALWQEVELTRPE